MATRNLEGYSDSMKKRQEAASAAPNTPTRSKESRIAFAGDEQPRGSQSDQTDLEQLEEALQRELMGTSPAAAEAESPVDSADLDAALKAMDAEVSGAGAGGHAGGAAPSAADSGGSNNRKTTGDSLLGDSSDRGTPGSTTSKRKSFKGKPDLATTSTGGESSMGEGPPAVPSHKRSTSLAASTAAATSRVSFNEAQRDNSPSVRRNKHQKSSSTLEWSTQHKPQPGVRFKEAGSIHRRPGSYADLQGFRNTDPEASTIPKRNASGRLSTPKEGYSSRESPTEGETFKARSVRRQSSHTSLASGAAHSNPQEASGELSAEEGGGARREAGALKRGTHPGESPSALQSPQGRSFKAAASRSMHERSGPAVGAEAPQTPTATPSVGMTPGKGTSAQAGAEEAVPMPEGSAAGLTEDAKHTSRAASKAPTEPGMAPSQELAAEASEQCLGSSHLEGAPQPAPLEQEFRPQEVPGLTQAVPPQTGQPGPDGSTAQAAEAQPPPAPAPSTPPAPTPAPPPPKPPPCKKKKKGGCCGMGGTLTDEDEPLPPPKKAAQERAKPAAATPAAQQQQQQQPQAAAAPAGAQQDAGAAAAAAADAANAAAGAPTAPQGPPGSAAAANAGGAAAPSAGSAAAVQPLHGGEHDQAREAPLAVKEAGHVRFGGAGAQAPGSVKAEGDERGFAHGHTPSAHAGAQPMGGAELEGADGLADGGAGHSAGERESAAAMRGGQRSSAPSRHPSSRAREREGSNADAGLLAGRLSHPAGELGSPLPGHSPRVTSHGGSMKDPSRGLDSTLGNSTLSRLQQHAAAGHSTPPYGGTHGRDMSVHSSAEAGPGGLTGGGMGAGGVGVHGHGAGGAHGQDAQQGAQRQLLPDASKLAEMPLDMMLQQLQDVLLVPPSTVVSDAAVTGTSFNAGAVPPPDTGIRGKTSERPLSSTGGSLGVVAESSTRPLPAKASTSKPNPRSHSTGRYFGLFGEPPPLPGRKRHHTTVQSFMRNSCPAPGPNWRQGAHSRSIDNLAQLRSSVSGSIAMSPRSQSRWGGPGMHPVPGQVTPVIEAGSPERAPKVSPGRSSAKLSTSLSSPRPLSSLPPGTAGSKQRAAAQAARNSLTSLGQSTPLPLSATTGKSTHKALPARGSLNDPLSPSRVSTAASANGRSPRSATTKPSPTQQPKSLRHSTGTRHTTPTPPKPNPPTPSTMHPRPTPPPTAPVSTPNTHTAPTAAASTPQPTRPQLASHAVSLSPATLQSTSATPTPTPPPTSAPHAAASPATTVASTAGMAAQRSPLPEDVGAAATVKLAAKGTEGAPAAPMTTRFSITGPAGPASASAADRYGGLSNGKQQQAEQPAVPVNIVQQVQQEQAQLAKEGAPPPPGASATVDELRARVEAVQREHALLTSQGAAGVMNAGPAAAKDAAAVSSVGAGEQAAATTAVPAPATPSQEQQQQQEQAPHASATRAAEAAAGTGVQESVSALPGASAPSAEAAGATAAAAISPNEGGGAASESLGAVGTPAVAAAEAPQKQPQQQQELASREPQAEAAAAPAPAPTSSCGAVGAQQQQQQLQQQQAAAAPPTPGTPTTLTSRVQMLKAALEPLARSGPVDWSAAALANWERVLADVEAILAQEDGELTNEVASAVARAVAGGHARTHAGRAAATKEGRESGTPLGVSHNEGGGGIVRPGSPSVQGSGVSAHVGGGGGGDGGLSGSGSPSPSRSRFSVDRRGVGAGVGGVSASEDGQQGGCVSPGAGVSGSVGAGGGARSSPTGGSVSARGADRVAMRRQEVIREKAASVLAKLAKDEGGLRSGEAGGSVSGGGWGMGGVEAEAREVAKAELAAEEAAAAAAGPSGGVSAGVSGGGGAKAGGAGSSEAGSAGGGASGAGGAGARSLQASHAMPSVASSTASEGIVRLGSTEPRLSDMGELQPPSQQQPTPVSHSAGQQQPLGMTQGSPPPAPVQTTFSIGSALGASPSPPPASVSPPPHTPPPAHAPTKPEQQQQQQQQQVRGSGGGVVASPPTSGPKQGSPHTSAGLPRAHTLAHAPPQPRTQQGQLPRSSTSSEASTAGAAAAAVAAAERGAAPAQGVRASQAKAQPASKQQQLQQQQAPVPAAAVAAVPQQHMPDTQVPSSVGAAGGEHSTAVPAGVPQQQQQLQQAPQAPQQQAPQQQQQQQQSNSGAPSTAAAAASVLSSHPHFRDHSKVQSIGGVEGLLSQWQHAGGGELDDETGYGM